MRPGHHKQGGESAPIALTPMVDLKILAILYVNAYKMTHANHFLQ